MRTIHVLLQGRLGNNMFQIAAGMSLAKRHGCEFVAVADSANRLPEPDGCLLRDYLRQFERTVLRNVRIEGQLPERCTRYVEPSFAFRKLEYADDLVLSGYFQSEKYFDAAVVRDLFAIDAETDAYIRSKYGALLDRGMTAINVRRGDYVKVPWRHPPCAASYYHKAIAQFAEGEHFLVISDDIAWCRKVFRGANFHFVDDEPPLVDLYLQTKCTHNIISNSTFSWWGAWLNPNPGKLVICPHHWFGEELSHLDVQDLRPESWVQIDSPLSPEFYFRIARRRQRKAFARVKRWLAKGKVVPHS